MTCIGGEKDAQLIAAPSTARCPIKEELPSVSDVSETREGQDSKEPLKLLVPFLPVKTEQVCQDNARNSATESIKQDAQLITAPSTARCPIKAELPSFSDVSEMREGQDSKEPLKLLVPFLPVKTEQVCRDDARNSAAESIKQSEIRYHEDSDLGCLQNKVSPLQYRMLQYRVSPKQNGSELIKIEDVGSNLNSVNSLLGSTPSWSKCDVCDGVFSDYQMLIHREFHEPFKCPTCGTVSCNSTTYQAHLLTHSPKDIVHQRIHENAPGRMPIKGYKVTPSHNLFRCQVCDKEFLSESNLIDHNLIDIHEITPERTPIEGYNAIPYQALAISQSANDISLKCNICGKSCMNKESLTLHKLSHTLFQCQVCDEAFSSESSLIYHQRIHRSDRERTPVGLGVCELVSKDIISLKVPRKPFVCNHCGMSYSKEVYLRVHLRSRHSGAQPFYCTACDKSFPHRLSLKIHMRIHTGENPFICNACSRGFISQLLLIIHEQTCNYSSAVENAAGPSSKIN